MANYKLNDKEARNQALGELHPADKAAAVVGWNVIVLGGIALAGLGMEFAEKKYRNWKAAREERKNRIETTILDTEDETQA